MTSKKCTYPNGSEEWMDSYGRYHREDGPAIITTNGTVLWFIKGKYHREDGPAAIYPDGEEQWYANGVHHREDGPAIIMSNGTEYWYKNGELHRADGPAVIRADGKQYWFLADVRYRNVKTFAKEAKWPESQLATHLLLYGESL